MGLIAFCLVYGFAAVVVILPTWLFIMAMLDRVHGAGGRQAPRARSQVSHAVGVGSSPPVEA
jgi:hypothetical protein